MCGEVDVVPDEAEQLDRVGDDPVAAAREAHHALERRERARRGLRRTARTPQLVQQLGDVVDRERGGPAPPQRRQQVALELVAVGLKRARVALAGGDLSPEAVEPTAGNGLEAKPKRSLPAWRQQTGYCRSAGGRCRARRERAGAARSHRNPPCLGSRPSLAAAPPEARLTEG
jgi:hypothetical protein